MQELGVFLGQHAQAFEVRYSELFAPHARFEFLSHFERLE